MKEGSKMQSKGKIKINVYDIIGEQSGRLKVIGYKGFKYSSTKGGLRLRHYYICKCECGNITIVQRGPLKNKITRSCGCRRGVKYNGN